MRKQKEEAWNHELAHKERKERLAKLKDSSGGKKPLKQRRSLVGKIVAIVIAFAVIVGLTGFGLVRFGVPATAFSAAQVGDEKVTPLEINIYLSSMMQNQMQQSLFSPEGQKALEAPYQMGAGDFKTMREYLIDSTLKQIRQDIVMNKMATEANFKLSDEDKETVESVDKYYKDTAEKNKVSVGDFLVQNFGPGASLETVHNVIERSIIAGAFQRSKMASFTYEADKIEKGYQDNKNDIDTYTFRSFTVKSGITEQTNPEEKKKLAAEADEKAKLIEAEITTPDSLIEIAKKYCRPEERVEYDKAEKTLKAKQPASQLPSADLTVWVSDPVRKEGDKKIVKEKDDSTVYVFVSRQRPEEHNYSVRHALIKYADVKDNKPTEEQIATAKTKADEVMAEFEKGDKSEASFGEIAKKYSEDNQAPPGGKSNADNGGLYENVKPGQMVPEFNDWCVDPARKAGDTTIVKTQFGFHLMYFVSSGNEAKWQVEASNYLRQKDFTDWREAEINKVEITQNSFGMRFVGPSSWTMWVYHAPAK